MQYLLYNFYVPWCGLELDPKQGLVSFLLHDHHRLKTFANIPISRVVQVTVVTVTPALDCHAHAWKRPIDCIPQQWTPYQIGRKSAAEGVHAVIFFSIWHTQITRAS
jgi:hypothetical protein